MKAKSHQGTGTPRSGTLGIIVLLAVAGLLLVALPARILECDAVIFANGAIHNDPTVMVYPHHLAYNYMLRGAALVGQGLDPPLNSIYLIQYVSIAAGLGGVYLLYRMLMGIGAGQRRALLLSGVLLFSYGYWHYARQADAHIISVFLLIWATWVFYRFLARPTIAAGCVVGLSFGLATFIHQSNILIFVPVLLACILRRREGIRLLRQTGAIIAVYFLTGILPYLLIGRYVVGAGTPAEFRKWLLGISLWENWGVWRLEMVPATVIGIVRTLTGSHYLLGFQPLVHLAQRLFPIASLEDEIAIAASVPSWLHLPLLAVQSIVLVFTLRAILRGPTAWKHMFDSNRAFAVFLLAWIVLLAGFFAWWGPERVEFWIAWLVPVILVVASFGPRRAGGGSGGAARAIAFLGGLFIVNFFGSIYPQSGPIVERDTDVAVAVDAVVGKGDIVVSDCFFSGRASIYVQSFERVNLLEPLVPRPAPRKATVHVYEDGFSEGAPLDTDRVDEEAFTHLKTRALARLDSLVAVASDEDRAVYLLMTPVSPDPRRALLYRELLDFVGEHYDISETIPVRRGLDLRRFAPGPIPRSETGPQP